MSQKNLNHEKNNIISLFNEKKFDKISKISSKILEQFNEQIEIVKIVVISYLNQKNYFKAEQYLKNSLLELDSAELYYFLGNTYKIQDKNLEAIDAYKKSISLNSDYSEAYNNLANVQKKIGMLDEASSNYLNAINCKKDNIEAYYNLANLKKSQKNYVDAIKNYNKVIKINSNFADAYNNIGTINSILGKFEEAKKFFVKAIKINNLFSEPYKNYVQSINIKENDKIFNSLLEIINRNDLNDEQKEVFYYSASKGFFDLNKKEAAFKYLNLANEIKFSRSNYSFKKEKKEFKELRLRHGIPDFQVDKISNKSFLMEMRFDKLNGLSWDKGCYLGQEVTARMHYRKKISKKIFQIKINLNTNIDDKVLFDDDEVGVITSHDNKNGFAYLDNKLSKKFDKKKLRSGDSIISFMEPWWSK